MSFYNHPSLWECCSVGLRCCRPPLQTKPPTRSLETSNRARMAPQSGLSWCTATNAHYHRCELFFFFNLRGISTCFFIPEVYFLSKPNMLLMSCMLYAQLSRGNRQRNTTFTPARPAQQCTPVFTISPFISSLLLNRIFICK